ncbi:hypothetical protein EJB05_16160, partial [Eragrostis curvula]
MAAAKAYVLMFTAFFFSGLMQLSMAQDKPAVAAARVIDAQTIDQAIAYMLIVSTMATMKVYVPLFMAFFSGFMQLSMAQDNLTAAARVIDAKAIDQAIAYLLMFAALFVTYFAH